MIKRNPLDTETIGDFCRVIRERSGQTQRALAEYTGIGYVTIARAEMDRVERPYELLRALKQYMSIKEVDFMYDLLRAIDIKALSESTSENVQDSSKPSAPNDSERKPAPASVKSPSRERTIVRKRPIR